MQKAIREKIISEWDIDFRREEWQVNDEPTIHASGHNAMWRSVRPLVRNAAFAYLDGWEGNDETQIVLVNKSPHTSGAYLYVFGHGTTPLVLTNAQIEYAEDLVRRLKAAAKRRVIEFLGMSIDQNVRTSDFLRALSAIGNDERITLYPSPNTKKRGMDIELGDEIEIRELDALEFNIEKAFHRMTAKHAGLLFPFTVGIFPQRSSSAREVLAAKTLLRTAIRQTSA